MIEGDLSSPVLHGDVLRTEITLARVPASLKALLAASGFTISAFFAASGCAMWQVRAAYVAMSRLTALRALAAGTLPAERAEALLDVLSREAAL